MVVNNGTPLRNDYMADSRSNDLSTHVRTYIVRIVLLTCKNAGTVKPL